LPGPRNRRDALLSAALDGFAQRGYDGTTVAELAAATAVSKAAVSYHFPTKDDLLHALADPLLDSLHPLLERHPQAPTWPDQVTNLTAHTRFTDTLGELRSRLDGRGNARRSQSTISRHRLISA
jgi:AcrR family transcriptional regulator